MFTTINSKCEIKHLLFWATLSLSFFTVYMYFTNTYTILYFTHILHIYGGLIAPYTYSIVIVYRPHVFY